MAKYLLPLFLSAAFASKPPRLERIRKTPVSLAPGQTPYTTHWFQEDLDHINRDPGSIDIRVLQVNSNYSLPTGPLIIYTGNEGPIDQFYSMSGFLTDVLPNYWNCTIYFLEHRYYGESKPSPFSWEYLNTDQVLYDYADLIQQLKPTNATPVIVFGGSYGGMLSAWMRMKYPHLVDGAIASSAPVLMGLDNGEGYSTNVTEVLRIINPVCPIYIQQAFSYLSMLQSRSAYYPILSDTFHSCTQFQSEDDVQALINWLVSGIEGVVQSNYPGVSDVDQPLASWPANLTCEYFANYSTSTTQNIWTLLTTMAEAANSIYNFTGSNECFDFSESAADDNDTWTYQTCTELWCPQGTNNITDVFPPDPWNALEYTTACQATYGVTPNPNWVQVNYGMNQNYVRALKYASNIMFMNGAMDPWRYGCIQTVSQNPKLYTHVIQGGAHHTDLRAPTPEDPEDVIVAREMEIEYITNWINNKKKLLSAKKPDIKYA